jgi:hypothetical protein
MRHLAHAAPVLPRGGVSFAPVEKRQNIFSTFLGKIREFCENNI